MLLSLPVSHWRLSESSWSCEPERQLSSRQPKTTNGKNDVGGGSLESGPPSGAG